MEESHGRFYLKLTDSKNLIGEFSNNNCNGNYTESADLDPQEPKPDDGKFSGYYYSTWHDDCNRKHTAVITKLKIEKKSDCEDIFRLTWSDVTNGQMRFQGAGILCDGTLIGDYHPAPLQNPSIPN